jgi:hypothetical protein
VAEGVVYGFESVQVDEQHGDRLRPEVLTQRLFDPCSERLAVRQPSQRVVTSLVAKLVLQALAFAYLVAGHDDAGNLRVLRSFTGR